MQIVYILLSLAIIVLLVYRKRIDFVSLGSLTFVLYTSPCFYGSTWVQGYRDYAYYANVSLNTYICVCSQLFVILAFLLYKKNNEKSDIKKLKSISMRTYSQQSIDFEPFWRVAVVVSILVFFVNIFYYVGVNRFFSNVSKSEMFIEASPLLTLAIWSSIAGFIYFFKRKNYTLMVTSFVAILFTFILGSRAYLTTALLGAFVISGMFTNRTVRSNLKIVMFGFFAALLLVLYKSVYIAVRTFDFAYVQSTLEASDMSLDAVLKNGEFITVFSIYDYIVRTNYELPIADTITRLLSFIPFLNNAIETSTNIRLSNIATHEFFSTSYGVGGNFWGETYAMGGLVFVIIITILWVFFLDIAFKKLLKYDDKLPFVALCATYCSFYIHRLDWIQALGCVKMALLLYILYYLAGKLFVRKKRSV